MNLRELRETAEKAIAVLGEEAGVEITPGALRGCTAALPTLAVGDPWINPRRRSLVLPSKVLDQPTALDFKSEPVKPPTGVKAPT